MKSPNHSITIQDVQIIKVSNGSIKFYVLLIIFVSLVFSITSIMFFIYRKWTVLFVGCSILWMIIMLFSVASIEILQNNKEFQISDQMIVFVYPKFSKEIRISWNRIETIEFIQEYYLQKVFSGHGYFDYRIDKGNSIRFMCPGQIIFIRPWLWFRRTSKHNIITRLIKSYAIKNKISLLQTINSKDVFKCDLYAQTKFDDNPQIIWKTEKILSEDINKSAKINEIVESEIIATEIAIKFDALSSKVRNLNYIPAKIVKQLIEEKASFPKN